MTSGTATNPATIGATSGTFTTPSFNFGFGAGDLTNASGSLVSPSPTSITAVPTTGFTTVPMGTSGNATFTTQSAFPTSGLGSTSVGATTGANSSAVSTVTSVPRARPQVWEWRNGSTVAINPQTGQPFAKSSANHSGVNANAAINPSTANAALLSRTLQADINQFNQQLNALATPGAGTANSASTQALINIFANRIAADVSRFNSGQANAITSSGGTVTTFTPAGATTPSTVQFRGPIIVRSTAPITVQSPTTTNGTTTNLSGTTITGLPANTIVPSLGDTTTTGTIVTPFGTFSTTGQ
jgi:hypothetical protein